MSAQVDWKKAISRLLPHLRLLRGAVKHEVTVHQLSFMLWLWRWSFIFPLVSRLVPEQSTLTLSIFICKVETFPIPDSYDGNEDWVL